MTRAFNRKSIVDLIVEHHQYNDISDNLDKDSKQYLLEAKAKFWIEQLKSEKAYNKELYKERINQTLDLFIKELLDSCATEEEKKAIEEKLGKLQVGDDVVNLRKYLLTQVESESNDKFLASLMRDISRYAQLLINLDHEKKLLTLEAFPNSLAAEELQCVEGTSDRLDLAFEPLNKSLDPVNNIILEAHARVVEKYNIDTLKLIKGDVHSSAATKYSILFSSLNKGFAKAYYFQISDELAWRHYINYLGDLEVEIRNSIASKVNFNKEEILKFLEQNPISCKVEGLDGDITIYRDISNKEDLYYRDYAGFYYKLKEQTGSSSMKIDEKFLRKKINKLEFEPILNEKLFEEYLQTLGLFYPGLKEFIRKVKTELSEGKVEEGEEEYYLDYSNWETRKVLEEGEVLVDIFLRHIQINSRFKSLGVEVMDQESKAEVEEQEEKTMKVAAEEDLSYVTHLSSDINDPELPKKIAILIDGDDIEGKEAAIVALYTISRDFKENSISRKIYRFINYIAKISSENPFDLAGDDLDVIIDSSVAKLEELKSKLDDENLERLDSVIDRCTNLKSFIIEKNSHYTKFFMAIMNNDLGVINSALSSNPEYVNQAWNNGATPLHIAAHNGHIEVVNALLAKGAEVNEEMNYGSTPLHFAAQNGNLKVVEILLAQHGVQVDKPNTNDDTPLHFAARNGHPKVVEILLAKGADVNKTGNQGHTPLHFAAENGHPNVVEIILKQDGVAVNEVSINGLTPLHMAVKNDHPEVVKALLKQDEVEVDKIDTKGNTPLLIAAYKGHLGVVKALLEKGVDVDKEEVTPLYVAALKGHQNVVEILLAQHGVQVDKTNTNGDTPLLIAAENGHPKVVEILLAKGADVNKTGNEGHTPLHFAVANGHLEIVRTLLAQHGVQVDKTNTNITPLLTAVCKGNLEVVKVLLENGANINQTVQDYTPLHFAAERGHPKVVEILLENGANINEKGNNGCTPLHFAAENGHLEIVKALLEKGADVNKANNNGFTPIVLAILHGNTAMVRVLLENSPNIELSFVDRNLRLNGYFISFSNLFTTNIVHTKDKSLWHDHTTRCKKVKNFVGKIILDFRNDAKESFFTVNDAANKEYQQDIISLLKESYEYLIVNYGITVAEGITELETSKVTKLLNESGSPIEITFGDDLLFGRKRIGSSNVDKEKMIKKFDQLIIYSQVSKFIDETNVDSRDEDKLINIMIKNINVYILDGNSTKDALAILSKIDAYTEDGVCFKDGISFEDLMREHFAIAHKVSGEVESKIAADVPDVVVGEINVDLEVHSGERPVMQGAGAPAGENSVAAEPSPASVSGPDAESVAKEEKSPDSPSR